MLICCDLWNVKINSNLFNMNSADGSMICSAYLSTETECKGKIHLPTLLLDVFF